MRGSQGTGETVIFKDGQSRAIVEPGGRQQPGQREGTGADPVLCFLWVAGKSTWVGGRGSLRPYDSSGPDLNTSSISVPGVDGKRMHYQSALFPPSPQISDTPKAVSAAASERHSDRCCCLTEPRRHPPSAPTPTPPFRRVRFRLPSRKAEVDIQDCFWWGLLPIKTPTVGCLPSFHFSKGAKASFRKIIKCNVCDLLF